MLCSDGILVTQYVMVVFLGCFLNTLPLVATIKIIQL